ncbi:hypothetical protein lerEdw1_015900 [Lerista edwardsae]|nr:hypothetical protein lerEdw1_015900 [Lerista edwardsae]
MASLGGPFRVVHHEGQRFLCFYSGGSSNALRLHVTNTSEFWSCDVTSDTQGGDMLQEEVQDSRSKLREALEAQVPTLAVCDSKAVLEFPNGRQGPLTFDLFRLPLSEARKQLQELVFGLVGQVQTLEKHLQELSPPKSRGGAGQAATKRRLPGESLINPGFKSKKAPTGVDFDDL